MLETLGRAAALGIGLVVGLLVGAIFMVLGGFRLFHTIEPYDGERRTYEAEMLAGSASNDARVAYERQGTWLRDLPEEFDDVGFWNSEYNGRYYSVVPIVGHRGPDEACFYAVSDNYGDVTVRLDFHWNPDEKRKFTYLRPLDAKEEE